MSEELEVQLKQFTRERNEAFLSLDEQKIRAFQRKWNGKEMPTDSKVFWGGVHKAITGVSRGLPIEFRRKSKAWLVAAPCPIKPMLCCIKSRDRMEGRQINQLSNSRRTIPTFCHRFQL
jgi:hypothetical protein